MSTQSLKQDILSQTQIKPVNKPVTIIDFLNTQKEQIKRALPKHMDADRMARIVLTEIRKNPKLQECKPMSLFGAIIQCSQLGLEPASGLGHAYLLPYKDDVQLIIGYRGMLDLARRSGQIQSINVYEVLEDDKFSVNLGLEPNIMHERDIKTGGTGQLIAVYAVAKLKDGGTQFEVMTKAQIDKIRDVAIAKISESARKYSPWLAHYNEMAKKTVIRRLFKYLPISIELTKATIIDENTDAGITNDYSDVIDLNTGEIMQQENDIKDEVKNDIN